MLQSSSRSSFLSPPFGSRSRFREKAPKSWKRKENESWRVRINLLWCPLHQIQGQNLPPLKWPILGFWAQNPKKWRSSRVKRRVGGSCYIVQT
jgi:hypothetical protein